MSIATETLLAQAMPTLRWLQRSIDVHGGRGSAGYYHLWKGWSAPYPETTGYIIETLWDYYHRTGDEGLRRNALSCADWLCDIQQVSGAWPSGIGGALPPIVFDTGMILFGLTRSYLETGEERYATAACRATEWLLDLLESDGSWRQAAYVPGFVPSYYTRVIWAILYASQLPGMPNVLRQMQQALDSYARQITASKSANDWGFHPDEPAFTHTIAYTWRGFLESAVRLEYNELIENVAAFGRKLISIRARQGALPGALNAQWKGDWSFTCVTGNAQLSILLHRLFEVTEEAVFQQGAQMLYKDAITAVWRYGSKDTIGGVPGSQPVWGKYLPWRLPNWAAKFVLDAALIQLRT